MGAFVWLIIIVAGTLVYKSSKSELPHYRYFAWNVFYKLFFGLIFSLVYLLYYNGGDTTAYFEGSIALNNLFSKSPELYIKHMTSESTIPDFFVDFDTRTTFPPGWIYSEKEAFIICKIMSIFTFFCLKSYLAMTFIMSTIVSYASWKLFSLLREYKFTSEKILVIGVLFLPSVNFWCSGISKDSWVLIGVMMLIYHALKIISPQFKATLLNWIMLLVSAFIIYKIRSFVLYAALFSLAFSLTTRLSNKFGKNDLKIVLLRLILIGTAVFAIFSSIEITDEEEFLESNSFLKEAAVVQHDFATNDTYGSNRYSLGELNFTPMGLAKVAPLAIVIGIYSPFLWEALSSTLIFNGIESTVFLYFTFVFFRRRARKRIRVIRRNEVLMFALFFVILIAFVTGLASGLFGVLVRLRAILLPFFFLLITTSSEDEPLEEDERSTDVLN